MEVTAPLTAYHKTEFLNAALARVKDESKQTLFTAGIAGSNGPYYWQLAVYLPPEMNRPGEFALCWIQNRPVYCDRGHYHAMIDRIPGMDWQDGFPRYYFGWDHAEKELLAFLAWRLFKVRFFNN